MADRRRDDDDDRPRRRGSEDDERTRRDREEDEPRRGRDREDDRGSRRRSDGDDEPRRGGGEGSGYRYEKRDAEDARKRGEGSSDFDRIVIEGIKQWKPNDGDNRIRILPPTWKKPTHYGYDLKVHYGVGADRQSYLCLHGMKGEDDPIYEAYGRAKIELNDNEGDKELEKLVKDLKAKNRTAIFLIDRDHEKDGVQFWAMPNGLDMDIVQVMQDKRTGEVLPIDDPEDGYDVEFVKKGKGINTEYMGVAIARRPSPLANKASDQEKWMEFVVKNPIPDVLKFYDYEHISKAFGGASKRRREDDDEPRRGGSAREREEEPRRGRDEREERGGRDDDRGSRRGRQEEPKSKEPTWASVHDMTKSELVDLIEDQKLDIKPKDAKDTEDLADWVCEELKIRKPKAEEKDERRPGRDNESEDKLAQMRKRRERD